MSIRNATTEDVARMVELSHKKRAEYETYSPVFWKMAMGSDRAQMPFFHKLVENDDIITIVSEEDGVVNGFLIGSIMDAPPVYDPGGKVCMIDDYMVGEPTLWESAGFSLLERCGELAKDRGCVLQIIVCGQRDLAKSRMLKNAHAEVTSEWYVRPV